MKRNSLFVSILLCLALLLTLGATGVFAAEEGQSNLVSDWGMTLNDEIVVNFKMNVADGTAVAVTVGDRNVPAAVSNGILRVPVYAAELTEEISITVGEETNTFTVRQYCETLLGDAQYAAYHRLVKEMLNYGGAAQTYFSFHNQDLANAGLEDVGTLDVPADAAPEKSVSGEVDGISYYGASLLLQEKVTLRFYFTADGDIADYTFKVNGKEVGCGQKYGKYYIDAEDIVPQDLDKSVTVTVNDTLAITYSPMNYIVGMRTDSTRNLPELMKALYNYHLAAKEFVPVEYYEVSFNLGYNGEAIEAMTFVAGSAYGSLPTPTRAGYIFDSWTLEDGTAVTTDTIVSNSHTLYAKWNPEVAEPAEKVLTPGAMADPVWVYTETDGWVWHVPNNGQLLSTNDRRIQVTGHTASEKAMYWEFKYNAVYSDAHLVWCNNGGMTTVIYDAETGEQLHHTYLHGAISNYKLELGKWYRVLIMPDANASLGQTYEIGYAGGAGSGKVDLYIRNVHTDEQHKPKNCGCYPTYEVNFDLNYAGAENNLAAITVKNSTAYGELPTPTRKGYTFEGWYMEAACTNAVTAETIASSKTAHTLYAKWHIAMAEPAEKVLTPGAMADPVWTNTETDGWVWHVANNGQFLSTTDRRIQVTGHTASEKAMYWEFKYNGVSSNEHLVWSNNGGMTSVLYDAETGEQLHHTYLHGAISGYKLETGKWYRVLVMPDANASLGQTYEIGYAGGAGSGKVDLYIRNVHTDEQHKPKNCGCYPTYEVNFDLNYAGAENNLAAITVKNSTAYGELPAPTRKGYAFGGWYTEAVCTNAVTAATTASSKVAHTLYAKWTRIEAETPDYTNTEFQLMLSDPLIIDQGEPGKMDWGYVQFPGLFYNEDGHIVATYQKGTDSITYQSETCYKISTDGGITWLDAEAVSTSSVHGEARKTLMSNGKYFAGFVGGGSHTQEYLQNYTPAATGDSRNYGKIKLYFQEDLLNDPAAAEDIKITAREYDPETDEYIVFDVTVNWPYAPVVQMGDMVYPFKQFFALQNHAVIAVGDDLYIPIYREGFNSDATSREDAIMDSSLVGKSHVYLFKSSDNGRTWDYVSMVTSKTTFVDGLSETAIQVMPDGSFIMVMRTGDGQPTQIVRSTNGGETWTELSQFATCGVFPQILTLDCGVTLVTYGGRPGIYISSTSDPTGLTWESAVSVPLKTSSCCYTGMVPLDETSALLIYVDAGYTDANGQPVKSVLVRTITVIPAGEATVITPGAMADPVWDEAEGAWHIANNGQNLSANDRRIELMGLNQGQLYVRYDFKVENATGAATYNWAQVNDTIIVLYDAETGEQLHHSYVDGATENYQLEAGKWYRVLTCKLHNQTTDVTPFPIGYPGGTSGNGNIEVFIRNVHTEDQHGADKGCGCF